MLTENIHDSRCNSPLLLPRRAQGTTQFSLRIQLQDLASPWLGAFLLGLGLVSGKILAGRSDRDAKSPLTSEASHEGVITAIMVRSAQTE